MKNIKNLDLLIEKTIGMSQEELNKVLECIKNMKTTTHEVINNIKGFEQDEHEEDGSGDYLCDCCNSPVNREDWCFTCNDYVYIHHIND